jgi:hypothetical protein
VKTPCAGLDDAKECSYDLSLSSLKLSLPGAVPIAVEAGRVHALGADGTSYEFNLTEPHDLKTRGVPAEFDGISAPSIQFRAISADQKGDLYDWVIFDEGVSGQMKTASVALKEPSGSIVFLESGRKWFVSESKSDVKLLAAYPHSIVFMDGPSITIIKRGGSTFELVKQNVGFVEQVFSVSPQEIILLGKDNKLKIISIDNADRGFELKAIEFDISNSDEIMAVGHLKSSQRLLTFAQFNKVLDVNSLSYSTVKKFVPFASDRPMRTIQMSEDQILGILENGTINIVKLN